MGGRYHSGVYEERRFDAMGRLKELWTTMEEEGGGFSLTYRYDRVGSAVRMYQGHYSLSSRAVNATTAWEYDARYRLKAETVTGDHLTGSTRTEYDWDDADNRSAMRQYEISGTTTSLVSAVDYYYNELNQLRAHCSDDEDIEYYYDANGSRTNAVSWVGGSSSSTAYSYDEDNRLIAVSLDAPTNTHTFAYDYRSRRIYRSTPTEANVSVFDGGLAIQEYVVGGRDGSPQPSALRTEFIRGEGMGGGVGGMVYSIQNGDIICSHANHRGDVIARSSDTGSLTYFALYEAYGTRPYEWGDDPDRQKANTKEEESDLGLLNEGMRYRDLETGTFLTRDPIRYTDGPNMYCYVHCNPITRFDAFGLETEEESEEAAEEWYEDEYDGDEYDNFDDWWEDNQEKWYDDRAAAGYNIFTDDYSKQLREANEDAQEKLLAQSASTAMKETLDVLAFEKVLEPDKVGGYKERIPGALSANHPDTAQLKGHDLKTFMFVVAQAEAEADGKKAGWPYAHVLVNAIYTRNNSAFKAWRMSAYKEGMDTGLGMLSNFFGENPPKRLADARESACQPIDWKMNKAGRSIPDSVSPMQWADLFKYTPEGEAGIFNYDDGDSMIDELGF